MAFAKKKAHTPHRWHLGKLQNMLNIKIEKFCTPVYDHQKRDQK